MLSVEAGLFISSWGPSRTGYQKHTGSGLGICDWIVRYMSLMGRPLLVKREVADNRSPTIRRLLGAGDAPIIKMGGSQS